MADGAALEIDVKDDWDKNVHMRLPRDLVEAFSEDRPISTARDPPRLDELDPGDLVTIQARRQRGHDHRRAEEGACSISWKP